MPRDISTNLKGIHGDCPRDAANVDVVGDDEGTTKSSKKRKKQSDNVNQVLHSETQKRSSLISKSTTDIKFENYDGFHVCYGRISAK